MVQMVLQCDLHDDGVNLLIFAAYCFLIGATQTFRSREARPSSCIGGTSIPSRKGAFTSPGAPYER